MIFSKFLRPSSNIIFYRIIYVENDLRVCSGGYFDNFNNYYSPSNMACQRESKECNVKVIEGNKITYGPLFLFGTRYLVYAQLL